MKKQGLLAWLALALASTGCSGLSLVLGFEEQVKRAAATAVIRGSISTEAPAEDPLVVVLARVEEDGRVVGVDSFVRVLPGRFAFATTPGRYELGAAEDRNGNGLADPD